MGKGKRPPSEGSKTRINLERYYAKDGTEKIVIKDADNNIIKDGRKKLIFNYSSSSEKVINFQIQKNANEKSIFRFYNRRSKDAYKPLTPKQSENLLKSEMASVRKRVRTYNKDRKLFNNGNYILFSKYNKVTDYIYQYISVRVRIYFDGVQTVVSGKGDYYYKQKPTYTSKGDKLSARSRNLPSRIPNSSIEKEIKKAVRRAIQPYGYEVKFKLLSWKFCYYRRK